MRSPGGEYQQQPKPKPQDVASKSLSGLESLVDQIPSIADGGGNAAGGGAQPGAEPVAAPRRRWLSTRRRYTARTARMGARLRRRMGIMGDYGAPFVGYGGGWGGQLMRPTPGYLSDWQYGYGAGVAPGGIASEAPLVGCGGGWGGQLMRPTPGLLSDWQYGYGAGVAPGLVGGSSVGPSLLYNGIASEAPLVGYGGGWGGQLKRPTPGYLSDWQYGYGAGVAPGYAPYNTPYYNGYAGPPPAHHQQYLGAPPLLDLHKQEGGVPAVPSVPSVGFPGFC
ncbi:unnamed protein product [Plutella xylostella]|uniref:(diamondback moth) hypothetical protein n=1 Tax=Plutella xylostella TaxID=51655 RepID=A0A8S4E4F4_PLUXY|nr:unnamed protein product [Plutella xylostella]